LKTKYTPHLQCIKLDNKLQHARNAITKSIIYISTINICPLARIDWETKSDSFLSSFNLVFEIY